ncbi:MAG: signal peptidase I [Treponema sp.]
MADNKGKKTNVFIWIITGIAVGVILKLFVIDFLHISGASMEPAIHNGSSVFINKLAYGLVKPGSRNFFLQWAQPKQGDIVIYLHDNKIVIKRCAAVSGTHLDYSSDSRYSLRVGDKKITLTKEQYELMHTSVYVPEGYILALGDNYNQSIDSRSYGFVSVNNIVGKVIGK